MMAIAPEHRATSDALRKAIGLDRLAGYRDATDGSDKAALDLYLWNANISAAVFEDLAILEVALRNACHERLRSWHAYLGHETPWYHSTVLTPAHMQDIARARLRVAQGKRGETEGRVVAELMFGFWRLLHSKVYEPTLWQHVLRFAYPNSTKLDRRDVYTRLDDLNTLRNRIAHHEPIHSTAIGRTHKDLAALQGDLNHVVRWLDPHLHDWLATQSRVPGLLSGKP